MNYPPDQPQGWQQPNYQQPGQYPPQQPYQPQPPKKKRNPIMVVMIVLGSALILCAACGIVTALASSHSNTNTGTLSSATTTTSSSSTPTTASNQHFKPGDNVTVGSTWQITVSQATTSTGDDIDQPASGNVYLLIPVSYKNISTQEQQLFGYADWTLRDPNGKAYDPAFIQASNAADGKIEAGGPAQGTFTYEVPAATKSFTFAFQESAFTSGQTIWDLNLP